MIMPFFIKLNQHCKEKLNVTKGLVWGKDTFNLLGINFSVDLDFVINLNYEPILEDINKSLNVWKKRFLTPLGKITDKNPYLVQVKSFVYVHPKSRSKCYKQIAIYLFKIYMGW